MRFLEELKRRKVVRALLVYLAAAFAVIQAADIVVPAIGMPGWTMRGLVWLAALGIPVAVVAAWVFDVSADGLNRPTAAAGTLAKAHWLSARSIAFVLIMLAAGAGAGWLARSAASSPVGDKSIAVIPFDNLSADAENAFFAIGIQDEILTQLQKISALRVVSRSSTMRYQPGPNRPPVETIGRELNARWVVEGSAARVGQEVRLNVQLIESATGEHLWAEVYDGDLTVQGILGFQAQVARRAARSLDATIRPHEAEQIDALPTEDAVAYDLFLQGLDLFGRRREEDLLRALDVFDQAIALDPDYARAHAGRALVYAVLPFYSDQPAHETATRGLAAAYHALELDSTVVEAHAAIGDLLLHGRYDLAGAEAALRRAVELRPADAQAWSWLAEVLFCSGRVEESLGAGRRAIALDPLSAAKHVVHGRNLLEAGRIDTAIVQLERAQRLDPTFATTLELLGAAYLQAGRHDDATDAYQRYAGLVGPEADVLVRVGNARDPVTKAAALRALDGLGEPSWRLKAYTIARAYMQLGEHDRALDWLERAREAGDPLLPNAFQSAMFVALRDEPRFRALEAPVRREP